MNLTLTVKTVYGRPLYYPACDKSTILAALLNAKTLSKPQLAQIQALGFTLNIQPDPAALSI